MIKINLLCVGRLKERYWEEATEEYRKRLQRFCEIKIIEIPDGKNPEAEGTELLKKISGYVIACDVQGKLISSEDLAELVEKKSAQGQSELTFLIGGSDGLSEEVRAAAREKISFGRVTYPHRMMRVILAEQIYRAFTIINHVTYHK